MHSAQAHRAFNNISCFSKAEIRCFRFQQAKQYNPMDGSSGKDTHTHTKDNFPDGLYDRNKESETRVNRFN